MTTPLDRIQSRLVVDGECLVYDGARDEKGYGRISVGGKNRRAHRVLYELAHGAIPDGLVVMHSCDNPPCCRLDHLSLGTDLDNVWDSVRKRRFKGASFLSARKTECKWGHPLTVDNVRTRANGWRDCRQCSNRRAAASRRKAA